MRLMTEAHPSQEAAAVRRVRPRFTFGDLSD
jgi:hypothetical protein